jgi:hypothetical protein
VTGWKPYECEFCGAKVYTRALLDHHKWLLHGQAAGSVVGGPVTFRCASCGAEFSERPDLLTHLAGHQPRPGTERTIERAKTPAAVRPAGRRRRIAV